MGGYRETEHLLQVQIYHWVLQNEHIYPCLRLFHSSPNGMRTNIRTAIKAKLSGMRKGVPDMCLPVPRHGCGSLSIELKTKLGKVSKEQREFIELLIFYGSRAVVCYSVQEAIDQILLYIRD